MSEASKLGHTTSHPITKPIYPFLNLAQLGLRMVRVPDRRAKEEDEDDAERRLSAATMLASLAATQPSARNFAPMSGPLFQVTKSKSYPSNCISSLLITVTPNINLGHTTHEGRF